MLLAFPGASHVSDAVPCLTRHLFCLLVADGGPGIIAGHAGAGEIALDNDGRVTASGAVGSGCSVRLVKVVMYLRPIHCRPCVIISAKRCTRIPGSIRFACQVCSVWEVGSECVYPACDEDERRCNEWQWTARDCRTHWSPRLEGAAVGWPLKRTN